MPLYDYYCADCGHQFNLLRPMAECGEPAGCPQCENMAQRFIVAPRLSTMRADVRLAHQTNERSAHAPRMSQGHRCGTGCNHNHGGGETKPALKQASGSKRPWMLGH